MEKDERCDNSNAVFNARVNENEMIISILEYNHMKKQIEYLKCKDEEQFRLRQNIRDENFTLKTENKKLKRGIINLVKILGG